MRYVTQTMAPDEKILFIGRFPWSYDLISLLWLASVIGIPFFLVRTLRKRSTEIVVTSRRFVYKRGIVALVTDEVASNRIRHVKVTQGWLGRFFNHGQIYVEGTDIGKFGLPPIRKPAAFRRALIVSGTETKAERKADADAVSALAQTHTQSRRLPLIMAPGGARQPVDDMIDDVIELDDTTVDEQPARRARPAKRRRTRRSPSRRHARPRVRPAAGERDL